MVPHIVTVKLATPNALEVDRGEEVDKQITDLQERRRGPCRKVKGDIVAK